MCPACKGPMVSLEFEGVEIDRCLECGGTWLDAGELELLVELAGIDTTALSRGLREAAILRTGSRRCPRCRRRLRIIEVGDTRKVELDRCPRGDGLWLDRGEMEIVVRSFSEGAAGAVAKFLGDLYRSELRVPSEGN